MSMKRAALRSASARGVIPSLIRRLLHLQPVLVGARQKEHVLAVEPLEAGDHVGRDSFVGMTYVRHAIRIGNRCRNVEFFRHSGDVPRQS